MTDLKQHLKDTSPYLRLADGESFTAVYKGWKTIPDKYNVEKEKFRYIFDVDGNEKFFDNGSRRLAAQISDVKPDTIITVSRKGSKMDTVYTVTAGVAGQDQVPF